MYPQSAAKLSFIELSLESYNFQIVLLTAANEIDWMLLTPLPSILNFCSVPRCLVFGVFVLGLIFCAMDEPLGAMLATGRQLTSLFDVS